MGQEVSVQDLISVIVPVYNTEKYINQCIQSVLAQTYTNWELLLVDDGSTDSSGAICDKYAAQDSRIKVLHKENTGVSDSKNKALDIAQGEYIIFLDSDDYWCINSCLEQLIATSKKLNADIVRGEYFEVDVNNTIIREPHITSHKIKYVERPISSSLFISSIVNGEYFFPLCILKKSALGNLRFNINRIFLEDAELYLQLCSNTLNCIYIPIRYYAYRKHTHSITSSMNPRKTLDAFSFSTACFDIAQRSNNPEYQLLCITIGIRHFWNVIKAVVYNRDLYCQRERISQSCHIKNILNTINRLSSEYSIRIGYPLYMFPLTIVWQIYNIRYHMSHIVK